MSRVFDKPRYKLQAGFRSLVLLDLAGKGRPQFGNPELWNHPPIDQIVLIAEAGVDLDVADHDCDLGDTSYLSVGERGAYAAQKPDSGDLGFQANMGRHLKAWLDECKEVLTDDDAMTAITGAYLTGKITPGSCARTRSRRRFCSATTDDVLKMSLAATNHSGGLF
jgi:hypothetical protein